MIKIYGTPNCSYCKKAKKICEDNNLQYKYLTVNVEVSVEQLSEMAGFPVKKVPQIFITEGGFTEYVGGFTELESRILNSSL